MWHPMRKCQFKMCRFLLSLSQMEESASMRLRFFLEFFSATGGVKKSLDKSNAANAHGCGIMHTKTHTDETQQTKNQISLRSDVS